MSKLFTEEKAQITNKHEKIHRVNGNHEAKIMKDHFHTLN